MISSDEAKKLLSDVMLGINLGIIDADVNIMKTMIMSEPAQIMKSAGEMLDVQQRDKKRAEQIRNMLPAV